MFRVWFEPTITGFERVKTGHALDCVVTVIGAAEFYSHLSGKDCFVFITNNKKSVYFDWMY
jgi:hypothetical protein